MSTSSWADEAGDAGVVGFRIHGCCICSDCGGVDGTAPCFWDMQRSSWAGEDSETDVYLSGADQDVTGDAESQKSRRRNKSVGHRLNSALRSLRRRKSSPPPVDGAAPAKDAANKSTSKSKPAPAPATDAVPDFSARVVALELELAEAASDRQRATKAIEALRNQLAFAEARAEDLTRQNSRLAADLHAERQQHSQTKRSLFMSQRSQFPEENGENEPVFSGASAQASSPLSPSATNANIAAIQSYFNSAANSLNISPLLPRTNTWMPGGQHPYTFHLHRVAEQCLPYLVGVLVGICPKPGAVLVGASAWNAYVDMPFNTRDLDFVVLANPSATPPPEFLSELLANCVRVISTAPEVQFSLAVLEAVGLAVGAEEGVVLAPRPDQPPMPLMQRVALAEQTVPVAGRDYTGLFKVMTTTGGARLKLGAMTLISLSWLPLSRHPLVQESPEHYQPLCNVSSSWRIVPAPKGPNPSVQVAPVPMLLTFLQESLASQQAWRLQKDLARLRAIFLAAWLQVQSRRGPLLPYYLFLEGLVQQYDPLCFEVMTFNKRLVVEALAAGAGAGTGAGDLVEGMSRASSRLSVSSEQDPPAAADHEQVPRDTSFPA